MRDDFVVDVGRDGHGFRAEVVPEFDDGGGGGCVRDFEWRDEARAMFEKILGAVLPAGFLGAGHRVRADEMCVPVQSGVAKPADFTFDAADIRDDGSGRQMRGDLLGKWHDLIHRRRDDDKVCILYGVGRSVGDGVAPWLLAEFQP